MATINPPTGNTYGADTPRRALKGHKKFYALSLRKESSSIGRALAFKVIGWIRVQVPPLLFKKNGAGPSLAL